MRSRAQEIAIILSKYKKRAGARGRTFDALTPPYPIPPAAKQWLTKWRDISGEFLILPDGQALSGTAHEFMMRDLGLAADGAGVTGSYANARKAGMLRGNVIINDDGEEELNMDVPAHPSGQKHAQQFLEQSSAKQFVMDVEPYGSLARTFNTVRKRDAVLWLQQRIGMDSKGQHDKSVPVNPNTGTPLIGGGASFSMATPKQGLRNVINKLKAQGHRASDFRTVYRTQPSEFDKQAKRTGFIAREWATGDKKQVYTGSRRIAIAHSKRNSIVRDKPQSLFKARVPKAGIRIQHAYYSDNVEGPEYLIPKSIPAKSIRKVAWR